MYIEIIFTSELVGVYQHFSQNRLFSILITHFSCSNNQLGSIINVLDMNCHKTRIIEESAILEAVYVLVSNSVCNGLCKLDMILLMLLM